MIVNLIAATAVLVAVGVLLSVWKAGRVVVFESLAHPLTKSIIHIRPDGKVGSVERVAPQDHSHHVVAS